MKNLFYVLLAIIGVTILFVICFIYFQPPFYFPKPTGKYVVGVKTFHWIDVNRKELLEDDSVHPNRELMVKFWYPAQGTFVGKPTACYSNDWFQYVKKTSLLRWFLGGFCRTIYVYEYPDAEISQSELNYPIIIFSHGSGGRYDSNSVHCQELASYGYIVIGISHTYESNFVQFPDGRIKTRIDNSQNKSFIERRKQNDSGVVDQGITDVNFVLNKLQNIVKDNKSIFYGHLDLNKIGIFGQSRGGSVAAFMSRIDSRIKAGVNMDGSLFGPGATDKINKPFMFILAGESVKIFNHTMTENEWKIFGISSKEEEQMVRERYLLGFEKILKTNKQNFLYVINRAGHVDLTNNALLIKHAATFISRFFIKKFMLGPLGLGPINGYKITEIINAYLVSFFDKYLKNRPSKLLDGKNKIYPEVENIRY